MHAKANETTTKKNRLCPAVSIFFFCRQDKCIRCTSASRSVPRLYDPKSYGLCTMACLQCTYSYMHQTS